MRHSKIRLPAPGGTDIPGPANLSQRRTRGPKELLRLAPYCLRSGGRIGIISFHSGEDRLVKQAFREGVHNGMYASAAKEVIVPSAREAHDNPRSSSAKFRWAAVGSESNA